MKSTQNKVSCVPHKDAQKSVGVAEAEDRIVQKHPFEAPHVLITCDHQSSLGIVSHLQRQPLVHNEY